MNKVFGMTVVALALAGLSGNAFAAARNARTSTSRRR